MAPIVAEDSWLTAVPRDETLRLAHQFLIDQNFSVTRAQEGEVQAKQGSQIKLRLYGGIISSPESLPKRAVVRAETVGDGTMVNARFEDTMGFGAKVGMKAKYARYLEESLFRLKALLPPQTPASSAPAALSPSQELHGLAELHAKGALTDDEFKAAKSKLLG